MTQQANRSTRIRVAVAGAVVIASAVVITVIYQTSRPPARRQVVVPVDPNDGWEAAYARGTSNIGTIEEMTRARQAFVDRYPRSPGTADVLNQLGGMYMQERKFAESVRAYEAAKQLVAGGIRSPAGGPNARFALSSGILDVNIAETHRQARDFARAEAILAEVMARPLPAKLDPQAYVPQAFVGPMTLADVRDDQRRPADADELRRKTADRAIELAAAHPADADWIASYAAFAYTKRVNALLETAPPKLEAARALADEFKRRAPAHNGMFGYDDMIAGIALVESREQSKRASASPPAATGAKVTPDAAAP